MGDECTFDVLNIQENILRGVYAYGFEKPSVIQSKSIPLIIQGKDIIAQAQSGTGKTGAFVIGSLCRINIEEKSSQILIIVPTRELADQVYNFVEQVCNYTDITYLKVVGGSSVSECMYDLRKSPHVLIGTPGRILDMIQKRCLFTDKLKTLIFDEADEILSYGFKECIYNIVNTIPETTQICLFSATMPDDIIELTDRFMNQPVKVLVKKEELTLEGIQQFYINVKHNDWKYDVITDLYNVINISQCIIYINHKSRILDVYERLKTADYPVEYITGDRQGEERKDIMDRFKSGKIRVLLSTDLLARGIDIQQLSLVINYDIPREKETYIHRIGRSGRYGRKGVAINFINESEIQSLKELESFYDTQINEMPENIDEYLR
tara:strand:+ start:1435 stop:2574 length:1140 start_codon:yes stop_codon:yes gene_type:complete